MSDDLKPGRELDALVASKVMGLKDVRMHSLGHPEYTHVYPNGDLRFGNPVPLYSVGWGAAGDVVEALMAKGHWFHVRDETEPNKFWVCFGEEMSARAATFPHAVCLAALKAVGVVQ